jgi:hypothetical protein
MEPKAYFMHQFVTYSGRLSTAYFAILTFAEFFHNFLSAQNSSYDISAGEIKKKTYMRSVSVTKITVAKRLIFSCFMEGSASAPCGEGTIDAPRDLPIPAL